MDPQLDSWVTETQSTLKGVTTASLTGQHSRLRRAKAKENWHNTGVSNDGQLVKPFKFVNQQELKCQNKSKLLSSIRSHVKQDTDMKRQAAKVALGNRKQPHHPHVLPKKGPVMQSRVEFNEVRRSYSSLSAMKSKAGRASVAWHNSPLNTYTGYDPLDRPRALFLLSHCRHTLMSSRNR